MERKISDFEKANFQAYTDLDSEAMEETIHSKGKVGGGNPLQLLFFESQE